MKVIFIGSDRLVFAENSAVLRRMKDYAKLFDFVADVVFSAGRDKLATKKIAKNAVAVPTSSLAKIFAPIGAVFIALGIIRKEGEGGWVISAQDPFEAGLAGFLVAKISRSRLQIQIHTDLFNPHFSGHSIKNRFRSAIARWLIPKADCVRVVSERIKKTIAEQGIKTKKEIGVLPIFSDFETLFDEAEAVDWRGVFSYADYVFVAMSRLEKEKNVDVIIRAFADFSVKFERSALVVAGSGSEKEGLKWLAKELNIEDKVCFVGHADNPFSVLKNANAFLQASAYEGYGMALAEAVYCGLPFVSTDAGSAPDFVKMGARGEICASPDRRDFREAMEKIYREKTRYELPKSSFSDKKTYLAEYKRLMGECL